MGQDRLKTVLIVDDEKHLREIIRFDLKKTGLRILEAENGQKAFELAQNEVIDLVLSDIRMPVASGIQLLTLLRDQNPGHPPFVFMTAFSDISSEEALAMGAEAFLRKPVSKQELLEVVEKALIPKDERWAKVMFSTDGARRLDYSLKLEAWDNASQDQHLEIGQGGMFLALANDFPASFEMLRFRVDSGKNELGVLEGLGQVRWVRQEADAGQRVGIGVEFVQMEEKSRINLSQYLQTFAPKAYIPLGKV